MSPDKKHHVHNIKTQKQTKPSQRALICTQKHESKLVTKNQTTRNTLPE